MGDTDVSVPCGQIQVSQRLAGSNLVDFLNSPTAKSNWIGGVFI